MAKIRRISGPKRRAHRRKDGETTFSWVLDYYDLQGKRRKPQFPNRAAADAAKTDLEISLRAGSHIHDAVSLTLDQAAQRWLKAKSERKSEALERSTLATYRQHIERHINDAEIGIGPLKLSQLTAARVQAFMEALGASRSADMVRRVMKTLRAILRWAEVAGLAGHNAAAGIRVERRARHRDREPFPTMEHLRAILKGLDARANGQPDLLQAFVVTCLGSGCRPSELRGLSTGARPAALRALPRHLGLALSQSAIGPKCETITIRVRADNYQQLGVPKSAAGRRTVDLGPQAAGILRAWLLKRPAGDLGLVFPNEAGGVLAYARLLQDVWHPFLASIGLVDHADRPLYGFKSLRHAAISLRIQAGWNPKRILAFAGHANIATTMDIYGHLWRDADAERASAAAVERLLTSA